jgi:oxygen-independent coproporphyrinogen-3 oxidase
MKFSADTAQYTQNTTSAPNTLEHLAFDAHLLQQMDRSGPRYTSYPSADRFAANFGETEYRAALQTRREFGARRPLSLYLHLPFCNNVCYYCGCNKIVTRDRRKAADYLTALLHEIRLQSELLSNARYVEQIHWGGGTPTYFDATQLTRLMHALRQHFQLAPDVIGEYSIEVDPRSVDNEKIALLRELGFNRISLGVQDFDPAVQKAVNRVQPEALTRAAIAAARTQHFHSISLDLIYGLPLQNPDNFKQTLTRALDLSPDRLAIYNYAHLPHLFKAQRHINAADLPSLDERLEMLYLSMQILTQAGYVYIGMDHFAKPQDSLAIAQRQGNLHRNFQGYSTHAECDLIGMGVSAIGAVGATYSQNEKNLDDYYARLALEQLPIARGLTLSMDDLLRRTVIHALMCHGELCLRTIEQAYPIRFDEYFARECQALEQLAADGLLTLETGWIEITLKGRLLIRNIAMVFDRYLFEKAPTEARYSKAI